MEGKAKSQSLRARVLASSGCGPLKIFQCSLVVAECIGRCVDDLGFDCVSKCLSDLDEADCETCICAIDDSIPGCP